MFKHILTYVEVEHPDSWQLALPKAIEMAEQCNADLHLLTCIPDFGMSIVEQFFPSDFDNSTVTKAVLKQLETFISEQVPDHIKAQAIVVPEDDPRGKHAVLHYGVRWASDTMSWLEIQLETGRTHQIRVQAASRGHAILGDQQYGAAQPFGEQHEDIRLRQIALHARSLSFRHPMKDESVEVIAPLSEPWQEVEALRGV